MWINSYQLENNVRAPFWVVDYLRERFEALERYLERHHEDEFDISLDISAQSEAAYLTIENKETWESITVSFRNHDNFADSMYDKAIWLSRYETWTDCKKHFLNEILPNILKELGGEKAC